MNKVKDWLSSVKNQRNLLIVGVIILILCLRSCGPSKGEVNSLKQNVFALNDSIRTYKGKNGTLVFEKGALISENGNLKSLNSDLAAEVKNLKDNPIVIIKTVIKIVHDTVYIPINVGGPTWNADSSVVTRNLNWSYAKEFSKGNYRKLGGDFKAFIDTSMNLTTTPMHITTDEFGMSISTGLTERKDGLLEIFVTSPYPGFSVTSLDGALIDPAKSEVLKKYFPPKRWALGVYGGYGVYFDPAKIRVGTGIQIGIGLQYNILQWNFKK
jgi:hypothetical protein